MCSLNFLLLLLLEILGCSFPPNSISRKKKKGKNCEFWCLFASAYDRWYWLILPTDRCTRKSAQSLLVSTSSNSVCIEVPSNSFKINAFKIGCVIIIMRKLGYFVFRYLEKYCTWVNVTLYFPRNNKQKLNLRKWKTHKQKRRTRSKFQATFGWVYIYAEGAKLLSICGG